GKSEEEVDGRPGGAGGGGAGRARPRPAPGGPRGARPAPAGPAARPPGPGEAAGGRAAASGGARAAARAGRAAAGRAAAAPEVAARARALPGGPPRFLVAKPGLDGHSNGAEQIAVAARDAGMEVIYSGIRLTVEQIAASARDEDPDVIGLSILSGSHLELVPEVIEALRAAGVDAPGVVGGIIPDGDQGKLREGGGTRD